MPKIINSFSIYIFRNGSKIPFFPALSSMSMSKYLAVENLAVKNNPKAVIVIGAGFILDQRKSCSVGSKLGSQRKYFLLKKEDME